MKSCNFAKNVYLAVATALLTVLSFSANAQTYVSGTLQSGKLASAVAVDASGNVYVMQFNSASGTPDGGGGTGEVVKYAANNLSGTPTVIATGIPDADNAANDYATGIVVDPINGDVYVVSDNQDVNNTAPYGIIYKLTNNGSNNYTKSAWITGNANLGYPSAIAIDASGNLYVDNYNGINNNYEIDKYARGSTSATALYQGLDASQLNESLNSSYFYAAPSGLAVNSDGSIIYVTEDFDDDGAYNDQGHIDKLTKSGSSYTLSHVSNGFSATGLALDASGNLFALQTTTANTGTGATITSDYNSNYGVYEYPNGSATQSPTNIYTPLHAYSADLFPFGIAIINDNNLFVTDGQGSGGTGNDVLQIIGTPFAQASNVSFSNTAAASTTVSWTNGSGSSRAVFMALTSSGAPSPANSTSYNANTAFGSGTQIGGSGWYCVYNGTGTSVNVTGLSANSTYRTMVVEYNGGALANQNYLTSTATNNPNNVTTVGPIIATTGTPSALSTISGTASSSTSFSVSGSNLTANVTATAPAGFDISLDNSTWSAAGGSVNLTESSGTLSSTPVYVRLDAGDAANTYSGNVALTSTGATTVNVAIPSSTVSAPPTIATTGTPSALSTTSGTPSSSTSFSVSGSNLTTNVTATAPAGFDISLDNSIWSTAGGSVNLTESSGTLGSTPVYVRLDAGDAANTYSGNVVLTSTGATTLNVAIPSSTVSAAPPAVASVNVTSGVYGINHTIPFFVTMSSSVNVGPGSPPYIPITIGSNTVQAVYVSGSGTTTLTFNYTVAPGDNGSVGIGSAITLPPGTTIQSTANSADAVLTLNNIGSTSGVIIDTQVPTATITLSNYNITFGQTATVTIAFNKPVNGVTIGGLTAQSGALSPLNTTDNQTYTTTFTPTANIDVTTNTITLSNTGITDQHAGNAMAASASSSNYVVNTIPPQNPQTLTFNAQTNGATVNATYGDAAINGAATSSASLTPTYVSNNLNVATVSTSGQVTIVGAGTATITASQAGNSNYAAAANISFTLQVAQHALTITAKNVNKTYGQTLSNVSGSTDFTSSPLANGETIGSVSIAYGTGAAATDVVGTYAGQVTPSLATGGTFNANNYNITYASGDIIVNQATTTLTLSNLSQTYDGTAKAVTVTTNPSGLSGVSVTYDGSATVPTAAGSYAVVASLTNANYTASNATGTLVIGQATATLALSNLSQTYDGTAKAATVTTNPTGLSGVTVTYDGSATVPTAAGSYAVVASLTNANYTATNATGTLVIGQATATLALSNLSQIYDGTGKAVTVTTNPTGLSGVSVTYDGSSTVPTAVGSYAVVALLTNANYTAANATGTLVIGQGTATLTLSNLSQAYDGTAKTVTVTTNPTGLSGVTVTYNGSTTAPTAAGSYAVVASLTNTNYTATDATGTLVIGTINATLTLSNLSQTYDGTTKAVTVTTNPSGLSGVSVTYNGSTTVPTAAGSYAVVASLNNNNYTATDATGTLVIGQATATLSLSNLSQTYDGTAKSVTVTSNPLGLSGVSVTYDGSATAPTAAGSYAVVASLNNSNYTANNATGTLVIGQATASLALSNLSQTYDGTAKSVTVTTNPTGLSGVNVTYDGSATVPTAAGSYAVVASLNNSNYTASNATGTLVIGQATATLALSNLSQTYDGTAKSVTVTTNPTGLSGVTVTYDGSATAPTAAGSYAVVASLTNANYTATNATGTLTIAQAGSAITFNALPTKTYGEADFAPGATSTNTATAITYSSNNMAVATIVNGNIHIVGAGSATITASQAADANHTASTPIDQTLTVNQKTITLTLNSSPAITKVYDGSTAAMLAAGNYTLNGILNGDAVSVTGTASYDNANAGMGKTVTVNNFVLSGAQMGDYSLSTTSATTTGSINPLAITVTADAQTKVYGTSDPALTYTTNASLVNGDSFSGSLSRTAGENVGTYAINQGTLSLSSNYTLMFNSANLTITSRAIAVTANAQTKVYGDADPALTYQITSGSLAGSDSFSGTLTRDPGENIGSYAINQGTLALSSNYSLTFTGANLTITTRAIAITADAKSKIYGDADPALTYQITSGNLVGTDSFSGSLTRDPGESVGTYAINQGTLALNSNYSLMFTGANLTITSRTIAVAANAQTKVYGDADPALTYQITSGSLAGSDSFSGALTRVPGENIGTYAINQGTLALSSNYNLMFTGANLTITTRAIAIAADAKTKVYGDADPALTYQINSGNLIGSDSFSGALTRVPGENIGTYAINQGTLALSSNYSLTFTSANLTITTRAIAVAADAKTKVYGDADPALTYQITSGNLIGSDSFSGALTRVPGENIGTYAINQGTLALSSNYSLMFTSANLTITTRAIAVAADAKTKVYGDADPALTYQITSGSLAGTDSFSGALTRDPGENVGTYAIKQGTLALNANYSLMFTGANLTITPATATLALSDLSQTYDGTAKSVMVTTNPTGLSGVSVTYNGSATAPTAAGSYAVVASLTNTNYTASNATGTLVITDASQVITFATLPAKTYGDADFAPGATSTNSGIPITYASNNTAVATIVNGDIHIVGAGSAIITASQAGDANHNAAADQQQTLTINQAMLTITADNQTRPYGQPNPTLTVSYSGFVNGDTQSKLSSQATANTTATISSAPGQYPITASGAADANYTMKYVSGKLTVTPLHIATLAGLSISAGTLTPDFSPSVTSYSTVIDAVISNLGFTATPQDPNASVTINGIGIINGSSYMVPVNYGNNLVTITVTAQDGVTQQTYTVEVTRKPTVAMIKPTNILTPNGDGVNDTWQIPDISLFPDNYVKVFDRGGREVYYKKGYTNDWGGTVNSHQLGEGTYYYIVYLGAGLNMIYGYITILNNH